MSKPIYTVAVNNLGCFKILKVSEVPYSKGTSYVKATRILKELQDA